MLYKVLLVDDDEMERRGLTSLSVFPRYSLVIVSEAQNGHDALEKAKIYKPDIVITDIRMPVMDGLAFVSRLKELDPGIRVIMMSGYEDFHAAKQALYIGADAYLTKPLRHDELESAIASITGHMDADADAVYETELLRSRVDEMLPIIRERLLRDLLLGVRRIDDKSTRNEIKEARLFEHDGKLAVILLKAEINPPEKNVQSVMLGIHDILLSMSMALILSEPIMIHSGLYTSIAFLPRRMDDAMAFDHLQQCAAYMLERVRAQSGHDITIAISSIKDDESSLDIMYAQAYNTMRLYSAYGLNRVYWYESEDNDRPETDIRDIAGKILQGVRIGDDKITHDAICGFFDSMQSANASIETIRAITCELLTQIIVLSAKMNVEGINIPTYPESPFVMIIKANFVDELCRYMTDLFVTDIKKTLIQVKSCSEDLADKAIEYIKSSFSYDISAETIAQKVFVTPAHLRRVFKNVTGQTIQDCILSFRMDKARELLRVTSMKVHEIAREVGYDNSSYFNIVFKKYFGVAPGEYRNNSDSGQTVGQAF